MECHRGRNMMYLGEGPWLCWRAGPVVMESRPGAWMRIGAVRAVITLPTQAVLLVPFRA